MRGIDYQDLPRAAERLREFRKPVLLLWAREDRLFPFAFAERWMTVFPNARLVPVTDSYTYIAEDQPQFVSRQIATFAHEVHRLSDAPANSLCGREFTALVESGSCSPAGGTEDRGDAPDQRGMGVAEQQVSARENGHGRGWLVCRLQPVRSARGYQGVGVAAEYMDRAGQRWFTAVAVAGTDPQVVADKRHQRAQAIPVGRGVRREGRRTATAWWPELRSSADTICVAPTAGAVRQ